MEMDDQLSHDIPYRPLGLVKKVMESIGAEVSYAFEDLVFITHNHFLLQFGKVGAELFFYRNDEISSDESRVQYTLLTESFEKEGIILHDNGSYTMTPKDDGTISLAFSSQV